MTENWSLSFEVSSYDSYTNMLFIYKLHISQSPHLQKQCQKNGGVGYNSPLLHYDVEESGGQMGIFSQQHCWMLNIRNCRSIFLKFVFISSL